jgi:hypothetical protein
MALSRFVVTARVTITPDVAATVTAAEPGTGAPAGPGNYATAAPGTSGKFGYLPVTFLPGMVVYADSGGGTSGPALLYSAIGAGNLRPFVDGQDNVGHAALGN